MNWRNYKDKLKKYFWFSREELTHFGIVVLVLALIYSWNDWGTDTFDIAFGFKNLLIAILLIGITVFVHHSGQRLYALARGFRAEQKLWWHGLLIALILVMLTNGKFKFFSRHRHASLYDAYSPPRSISIRAKRVSSCTHLSRRAYVEHIFLCHCQKL